MNGITNLKRREFLRLTGISTSGLALMATLPVAAGVLDEAAGARLNLFVSVEADGSVEIIAHRSEMGTGIRTSLPQVVADEMEADWRRVRVIQGLANADYGSQNTDGSRSIRDFYHIMRQMGATARLMLERAAAQQWGVAAAECRARLHAVHHRDGRVLGFGQLARVAARQPLPAQSDIRLKSREQFRYIGKNIPIVDLHDMTTGNTTYGADVHLPGMVYASIERTPVLDGRLTAYDENAARAVPGVLDVIRIDGTPGAPRFNALEGVAVIARHTHAAMRGRAALNCRWERGEHAAHDSDEYLDTLMDRVQQPGQVFRQRGEVEQALDTCARRISASYRTPYLAHAAMEPPMATAQLHAGRLQIWACTQTPQATQRAVAEALAMAVEKVVVHVTLLGGGFGRKSKPDYAVEAALLARATGKPVQVCWTREDDIRHDYFHSCAAQYFEGGLDDKGRLVAWLARLAAPPITSTFEAGVNEMPDGWLSQTFGSVPFSAPNLRLERHRADAHVRIGWLRSVYNIPFAFGVGCFIDELAHAAGKDPARFWLEAIGDDRELDFAAEGFSFSNYGRSLQEYPYQTRRLKQVIRLLIEGIPWGEKLPRGEGWGIGVARSFLSYVAVASKVRVRDGKLNVLEMHGVIDAGTVVNPDRVHAQLEGGMIFGHGIALMGEISFRNGEAVQSNFHDYPVTRMHQSPPVVRTHIVESDASPSGVGEPGVPPVAPSIANAVFAATGERVRELPLNKRFSV